MLQPADTYDALYRDFVWQIPDRYNIGVDVCTRWAATHPGRVALLMRNEDGSVIEWTFAALEDRSNRLANVLAAHGVSAGDRVAILLPQHVDVLTAHIAIYKLGAIAVPMAAMFGVDALAYRLGDSGAAAIITNADGAEKIVDIRGDLPGLKSVLISGHSGANGIDALIERASPDFTPVDTTPDTPALMIYTSGTTGPPKGALHGHRVLLGHLPCVQMPHEFLPQPGDLMWTPADWAWAGGLLNVLLPSLSLGVPVLGYAFTKFDPEKAYAMMADHAVRNAFIPPTALKMVMASGAAPSSVNLRTIGSGGEALGRKTYEWAKETLGIGINEFYGQTECNLVLSSCGAIDAVKPGAIGKPVPGHTVAIIDGDGNPCEPEELGQIAVRAPDPVMFLRYWNNDAATTAKFVGDWMITGDEGVMDADGFVSFVGRDDDIITSAGYRIGPGEIEDCLISHPAVRLAAAVGRPDPIRTEIVKAFVVLQDGIAADDETKSAIQAHVRTRLSPHEMPREIDFRDDLPLTTTGKIIRRLLREEV
ncbi:MAG: AMP-binding protein [Pseudomonadota bacterium]